jgi:hypothetical protein
VRNVVYSVTRQVLTVTLFNAVLTIVVSNDTKCSLPYELLCFDFSTALEQFVYCVQSVRGACGNCSLSIYRKLWICTVDFSRIKPYRGVLNVLHCDYKDEGYSEGLGLKVWGVGRVAHSSDVVW